MIASGEHLLSAITQALRVSHSPYSSNEQRLEAFKFCEQFKAQSLNHLDVVIHLIKAPETEQKHFGLLILQQTISIHWNDLVAAQRTSFKFLALQLMLNPPPLNLPSTLIIDEAIAKVVIELLKREWPSDWSEFDLAVEQLSTLSIESSSDALHRHFIFVLVYRHLFDIIFNTVDVQLPPQRSQQFHSHLSQQSPVFLQRMLLVLQNVPKPFERYVKECLHVLSGFMTVCPDDHIIPLLNPLESKLSEILYAFSVSSALSSSIQVLFGVKSKRKAESSGIVLAVLQTLMQKIQSGYDEPQEVLELCSLVLMFVKERKVMILTFGNSDEMRFAMFQLLLTLLAQEDDQIRVKALEICTTLFTALRSINQIGKDDLLLPNSMQHEFALTILQKTMSKMPLQDDQSVSNHFYLMVAAITNACSDTALGCVSSWLTSGVSAESFVCIAKVSTGILGAAQVAYRMRECSEDFQRFVALQEQVLGMNCFSDETLAKEKYNMILKFAPLMDQNVALLVSTLRSLMAHLKISSMSHVVSRMIAVTIVSVLKQCIKAHIETPLLQQLLMEIHDILPKQPTCSHLLFEAMVRIVLRVDSPNDRSVLLRRVVELFGHHFKVCSVEQLWTACRGEGRYEALSGPRALDHALRFLVELSDEFGDDGRSQDIQSLGSHIVLQYVPAVFELVNALMSVWDVKCDITALQRDTRLDIFEMWYPDDNEDASFKLRKWIHNVFSSCYAVAGRALCFPVFFHWMQRDTPQSLRKFFLSSAKGHVLTVKLFINLVMKPFAKRCPPELYGNVLKPVLCAFFIDVGSLLERNWNASAFGDIAKDTFETNARLETTLSLSKFICNVLAGKKKKSVKHPDISEVVAKVILDEEMLGLVFKLSIATLMWIPSFGTHSSEIIGLFSFYLQTSQFSMQFAQWVLEAFQACLMVVSKLKVQETTEFGIVAVFLLNVCEKLMEKQLFGMLEEILRTDVGLNDAELAHFVTEMSNAQSRKKRMTFLSLVVQQKVLGRASIGSSAASGALSWTDRNILDTKYKANRSQSSSKEESVVDIGDLFG